MAYALVGPKDTIDRRATNIDPNVQTKEGWRWLPVVTEGDADFDRNTQVKEGPVTAVQENRVVDTYKIRSLTAQEIAARKIERIDALNGPMIKTLFFLHNRIRTLEGLAPHTIEEFRARLGGVV